MDDGIHRIEGPTILTFTGAYFDFQSPETSKFNINDVAHALAHLCRFTGHTNSFYSVAEHSVHCSYLVPEQDAMAALLHDAAEAFMGDVSRPLKSLLPDYKLIEQRVEAAVFARFGLPAVLPPSVKQADKAMLVEEQRQAMGNADRWADFDGVLPSGVALRFWAPREAKGRFLSRFDHLLWARADRRRGGMAT
jgi:5'-deoxynucleotidase YfbR-like HD superfamily hydrolase